jgi:hypothetical protein
MTPRTPQGEVFFPLLLNSKNSGVLEDSKSPTLGSVSFILTLGQSGVATCCNPYTDVMETCDVNKINVALMVCHVEKQHTWDSRRWVGCDSHDF